MDVERIQKINTLALDLMKQGLAKTREEAIEQAEKVYDGKTEEYSEMRETMDQVEAEKKPEVEEQPENNNPRSGLNEDKVTEILEKNTQFLVKTIREFREVMQEMKNEIESLKNKLAYKQLPSVGEVVSKKEPEAQPVQQEQPQQQEKKQEGRPRSVNFKENEVYIEKFFYMGNK